MDLSGADSGTTKYIPHLVVVIGIILLIYFWPEGLLV